MMEKVIGTFGLSTIVFFLGALTAIIFDDGENEKIIETLFALSIGSILGSVISIIIFIWI